MRILSVIEVLDNKVQNMVSTIDDDCISKDSKIEEAEALFTKMALENGAREDNMNSYLEDGYYEGGATYCVNLTWS